MRLSRVCAVVIALALAPAGALAGTQGDQGNHGLTQSGPSSGKPPGSPTGSFGDIGDGATGDTEQSSETLDAIAGSPDKYVGKSFTRRVLLVGELKHESAAYTIAVKDKETGRRVDGGLRDGELTFVVLPSMADDLGPLLASKPDVVIAFSVARLPIPGRTVWAATISRVAVLGADGAVTKTIGD